MESSGCYVGVDVGTQGVRAGVVGQRTGRVGGAVLGRAERPLPLHRPAAHPHLYEQSSTEVWDAVCGAVRGALQDAGVAASQVRGIAFDATCSLVVVDAEGRPVSVTPPGKGGEEDHEAAAAAERNIIVWLDHRAAHEAELINATKHEVLKYVGGRISPEMESPKILWLKRHLPDRWTRMAHFFDLADYLTFKATGGDTTRSLCTLVCKWTFLGHAADDSAQTDVDGWQETFWRGIGLGEFVDEGYRRIGTRVRPMGKALSQGLAPEAAQALGLLPGTAVGVGIIDAHAGGIGILGCGAARLEGETENRLAIICGTSSCHMAVSHQPRFIEGIWGPYHSAMIPGLWLTEGGQSATGALLDHIIATHPASPRVRERATAKGQTIYEALNELVQALARERGVAFRAQLTRDLHVFPDFHGNRSPRADATLCGMISGLRLSATEDDLALLYLATIQSIAHGTRHIITAMNKAGYHIDTIMLTGGLSKNPLFVQEHADVTNCRVIISNEPDSMLLGTGMLAAVASGDFASIPAAMSALDPGPKATITPGGEGMPDAERERVRAYHDAKHAVFHDMHAHQLAYRRLMADS